jgi:hypothetical protein
MKIFYTVLLILLGAATCCYSQVADSLEQTLRVDTTQMAAPSTIPAQSFTPSEPDDFSPMLGMFALAALGFALFCIGAGAVLMSVLVCIVIGLVATGVLSASLLVSLKTKSVVAGAKVFWVLGSTTASLLVGAVALVLLDRVAALAVSTRMAMILGALSGAAAGFVVAQIVWWAGRQLMRYAQRRSTNMDIREGTLR